MSNIDLVKRSYDGFAQHDSKQLDVPFVHIWTLEGDKAIQFRQYLDTAGWVGLSRAD